MTKKWFPLGKKIGKFFLIIVFVLISIYGILGWYVGTHHDKLLQEVREIANKNCKGEVKIGDLEVENARLTSLSSIAGSDVAKAMTTTSAVNYAE